MTLEVGPNVTPEDSSVTIDIVKGYELSQNSLRVSKIPETG